MRNTLLGSVLLVLVALLLPASAAGQLLPPSPEIAMPGVEYSHEAAHDPVYNVVLFAWLDRDQRQALGRFLDNTGNPLGPAFVIGPGTVGDAVRVSYGAGNFLVVWSYDDYANNRRMLFSQVVSYPGGVVGPRQTIRSLSPPGGGHVQLGLAYSPEAQQFLVAWTNDYFVPSASMMRLDPSGRPIGGPISLGTGTPLDLNSEFAFTINSVDVVWNGVSGEFGVAYQDTPNNRMSLVLARVRIDGTIADRVTYKTNLPSRNIWSALDVNSFSGTYVAAWADSVGGGNAGVASIDPAGVLKEFSAPPVGTFVLDVVFSRVTGTFLLLRNFGARELGADGTPTTSEQSWYAGFPHATALPEGKWMVSGYGLIRTIASSTRSGGCATPDPFTVIGGGTCHNGGWLPPGIPAPAPPPPLPSPNPGGCVTPDPFVALGGGVCIGGGWRPPTAPPPPPPPPTGCITPDPFISIPGMAGICINGGWNPTTLVTVTGTMRFVAADGVWAIDDGNALHQLAGLPPIEIRVEGLQVKLVAKIRWDVQSLPGYVRVLEITAMV
ncbi:MAG TPA: hypothetical protein VMZ90_02620 [Vicinamibacterales bacterium]|nr:hypothetical protein [Vicinamibacterales bacterium]